MKPTELVIVLGYNAGDAPAAERLLDWMFELSGRNQIKRTIVIVAAPNVHAEMQTKVRLAANVAFKNVEAYVAGGATFGEKTGGTNQLFKIAAKIASDNFRGSWLWIEPDCVPLVENWLEVLEKEYAKQPKRFFGPHFKFMVKDQEKMCLGRVACYPNNAFNDLAPYCDVLDIPFNMVAAETIVRRSNKCRLFQALTVLGNDELAKIRTDAVMLHPDKTGTTIEFLRSKRKGRAKQPATIIANENEEADES